MELRDKAGEHNFGYKKHTQFSLQYWMTVLSSFNPDHIYFSKGWMSARPVRDVERDLMADPDGVFNDLPPSLAPMGGASNKKRKSQYILKHEKKRKFDRAA